MCERGRRSTKEKIKEEEEWVRETER